MGYAVSKRWYSNERVIFETLEEADAHCDEYFIPKIPRPMPKYEPLMVTPQVSNKNPNQAVAFIGKQLCFFESRMQNPLTKEQFNVDYPEIGVPVEVMITRPVYRRYPKGHEFEGRFNFRNIVGLVLCPVDPYYTLITHNGFECSGSMCSTTATQISDTDPKFRGAWMTPGRSQIFEASNVNAGQTWKVPYTARRPGKVWVFKESVEKGHFPLRVEGLARVEDAMYAEYVKK